MKNINKKYHDLVGKCNKADKAVREVEDEAMDENGRVINEEKFREWVEAMKRYNTLAYEIDALSEEIFIKQGREYEEGR
ncbi:MAG: hypothetical protein ACR2M6_02825 [Vampirovibrionia bacterium]